MSEQQPRRMASSLAEPYIRPMSRADLEHVMAIEKVSFPTPWSESAFIHELTRNQRAVYVVCAAGSTVLGYGGMWVFCGEAHITNLAVHPAHRRRGLGMFVFDALVERARAAGCNVVTLEVRESNAAAQNLYRKTGLEAVGRRYGYYTDTREDAIIMSRYVLDPGEDGGQ